MKRLRKALRRPWVACVVISVLILSAVLGVRAAGWLQRAELIVYDEFTRRRSDPDSRDDRIAIVGMTEDDLVKYGFPIDDAMMARVLAGIDAQQPCVIGLDMFRDLPEPRSGATYPQLEAAFKNLVRVIAIERIGFQKPPPALADFPDRIAANNLPFDASVDGRFRRGALFLEHRDEPRISLSLALVSTYLSEHGIDYDMVDPPGKKQNGDRPHPKLLKLGKVIFPRLTPDAGGYVGLEVKNYEYLIDFKGSRSSGPRIDGRPVMEQVPEGLPRPRIYDYSFGDVIEGRIPAGVLKGKIVLAGTVMPSIKDSNATPIDDSLRGVMQHAMCINQLLRAALDGEPPPGWWPEWAEIAWIALWTLLGGALGIVFRSPWKLAPALALVLAAIVFTGWKMFLHGTWILTAAPVLGSFIAATFVTSFIAYIERSERGHMQTLFSRHVSSDVVEALWKARDQFLDGGRMKPSRVTATVLFTDLKGFSTTSEKMDPATLMNWMNEYMNGVASHVDSHGGIINKFIGDAIMALFGVPLSHTSEEEIDRDARNAVECALVMRAEIRKLNADWTARGLPTTAMRVGIYTGPLVAGSMGSEQRLEFTVLGDTVNTAARLEGAGKEAADDPRTADCTILIGESTFQRLRGKFDTQLIGAMSLKGKADKIIVHSVISAV